MAKTKAKKQAAAQRTSELSRMNSEDSQKNVNPPPKAKAKKNKNKLGKPKGANFGALSTITTAPVAIGNSVTGASKRIVKSGNNVVIYGRDFMFSPVGTSAQILGWCLVGGTPLTPACFADSVLANYQRMYMKFRFKSFVAHYITSSPTSASGDVMFYYSKDRTSVFLNQTSNQLLPFVFSDKNTVLGPQWVNHSARFDISGGWKLTDYGMHDGIEEYADGDMYLLSKTTTADSPGYVIFDYVVEFAEENLQPRLLSFPIPRIQWRCTSMGINNTSVTKGTTAFNCTLRGVDVTGANAQSVGWVTGDVYKVIIDITNSLLLNTFTNCDASNLMEFETVNTETSLTLTDGFTCYGVIAGSNMILYQNITEAFSTTISTAATQVGGLRYGVTATITYALIMWLSYVGTKTSVSNVPNF